MFTDTNISEIFMEVREKTILEQHQNDLKISCIEKGEVTEKSVKCSIEGEEYSEIPMTLIEHMEEDEEIFRKLKIPWIPEGMHPVLEGKCIDSENENLQRSIKQYKHQIEYLHESNEGLVTANRRHREDLEEVNSHYQELISISKEAIKRKIHIEIQFIELKQNIEELT